MPGEDTDLWHTILNDVASHTASRRLPTRTLLVLGDEGGGKTSLLLRLQGRKQAADEATQGTGLEYTFLDVKDEESGEDVIGRLGVYTLDGCTDHRTLLQFVVNKETLDSLVVMIVLDYQRPWTMLQSFEYWMKTLDSHIGSLGVARLDELKQKVVSEYQRYSEAGAAEQDGADDIVLPLEEGVLTCNIGLPVIVVCNKSDASAMLENDLDYRNEHFDFMQMHLRKACLRYGAALVYCGKSGKTRDTLARYIFHRAYGIPCGFKANIAERDCVFVPSGWDGSKKIAMLHAGLKSISPDDAFEDHIVSPQPRKVGGTREQDVEDEQDFLKKQQQVLASNVKEADPVARRSTGTSANAASAQRAPSSPTPSRAASASTAVPVSSSAAGPAATKPAPAAASPGGATKDGKPAPQNADVLQNFFNSLLKKPSGAAPAQRADSQKS